MPNIVAHMAITSEVLPSPSFDDMLASALPDFVGMARDLRGATGTLEDVRTIPSFAAGVALHNRTDDVFDDLPLRIGLVMAARKDLDKLDIPKGARRTCADIGTDILLDGVLTEHGYYYDAYLNVKGAVISGETSIREIEDESLVDLINDYMQGDRPSKYRSSETTASMLQYRLQQHRGGRLGFNEEHIDDVAEVFNRQRTRLKKHAHELMALTIEKLRAND